MKTATIDNSDDGYIERVILWQYDNAEHLKDLILNLKGFYDKSTKDHFDEMVGRMNLADENIDDYGLSVWGKILNTNRPNLTYGGNTTPLSKEVYRKVLLGKIKLFEGSATLKEFIAYVESIFGDGVICTDGLDMSLRFDKNLNANLSPELDALITQAPDVVFVYPAGVRSSAHSTSRMFVFDEQKTVDFFTPGGLDESGFNWRLTAKGNWR
jgi:hypothetical protein